MKQVTHSKKANILYISHGGGPLPLLGEPSHQKMVNGLKTISAELSKPEAIIVVSAHWEADVVKISSAKQPGLLYDYEGFPPQAYEIKYPAQGNPVLAKKLFSLLQEAGISSKLDDGRDFDHGLYVPLKIMYPDADIPCLQISLLDSLNPLAHIGLGQALAKMKEENILFLGSGFSFHNMKAFFLPSTAEIQEKNETFDKWLVNTCSSREINENEREQRLIHWDKAQGARFCHPREEHLLPLHVCYGLAGSPVEKVFSWKIMGKKVSGFLW